MAHLKLKSWESLDTELLMTDSLFNARRRLMVVLIVVYVVQTASFPCNAMLEAPPSSVRESNSPARGGGGTVELEFRFFKHNSFTGASY